MRKNASRTAAKNASRKLFFLRRLRSHISRQLFPLRIKMKYYCSSTTINSFLRESSYSQEVKVGLIWHYFYGHKVTIIANVLMPLPLMISGIALTSILILRTSYRVQHCQLPLRVTCCRLEVLPLYLLNNIQGRFG